MTVLEKLKESRRLNRKLQKNTVVISKEQQAQIDKVYELKLAVKKAKKERVQAKSLKFFFYEINGEVFAFDEREHDAEVEKLKEKNQGSTYLGSRVYRNHPDSDYHYLDVEEVSDIDDKEELAKAIHIATNKAFRERKERQLLYDKAVKEAVHEHTEELELLSMMLNKKCKKHRKIYARVA